MSDCDHREETWPTLKVNLTIAQKWNYVFVAKLVRGAYIEQERRLAREKGYEDPINGTFEATSTVYQSCLDDVFTHMLQRPSGQIRIMVASHNEETIQYAIQK